ncbi:hypothetical protein LTR09_008603 [Extremus antarcticus]|uniref:Uncharacterized protein n=1 Tax=Extremus antarcticus TaxID=702011 RepID=A0AAJ0DHX6_9PEZI|nr:hypothetical protein LTR09_008603 [Extremus antarcticus]
MPLPTIQVNGVSYAPLLPGNRAFDAESITSLDRSDSVAHASHQSSRISAFAPALPALSPMSSLIQDMYGLALLDNDRTNEVDRPFTPPSEEVLNEYNKRPLPQVPAQEPAQKKQRQRKTQSVTFGAPMYSLVDEQRPLSRAGSVCGPEVSRVGSVCGLQREFSFVFGVEAEKQSAKWRGRTQKRHTMDLQMIREDRSMTDDSQASQGESFSWDAS